MSAEGLDTDALQRFLVASDVVLSGDLMCTPMEGGRSNLTYCVRDEKSTWVVRRPPLSGVTPSAHNVVREYAVTAALHRTSVPVAAPVACDPAGSVIGVPIAVFSFVPGRVIRSDADVSTLSDPEVSAVVTSLIDTLVDLHGIDPAGVGLADFGRPDGFLRRQVERWTSQWQRVATRELPDVNRLSEALAAALPQSGRAAIVHGDYRIDNTIVDAADPGVILAVLDWELATLGDPLADVALMCVYRSSAVNSVLGFQAAWTSPRLPSADDLAQRYAIRSRRNLDDWPFHLALANFKLAVIAEGIVHRALAGSVTPGAVEAGEVVPELLSTGLRALA